VRSPGVGSKLAQLAGNLRAGSVGIDKLYRPHASFTAPLQG